MQSRDYSQDQVPSPVWLATEGGSRHRDGYEAGEVRSGIAARDIAAVERAFSKWLEKDPCDQFSKDFFIICLADAISTNQPSILSYLLSQGIPYHTGHIKLAIEQKSTHILSVFLENCWDINKPINWSTPPLLSKAIEDESITEWFLKNGADPNAECDLDYTPLSVAVARAPFSTVQLLFSYGGTVQHGQLLHYAALRTEPDRLQVLDYILLQGATGINSLLHQHRPNNYEMLKPFGLGTPLHAAATKGLLDTVQHLLGYGANPMITDSKGYLAIECARYANHFDVVDFLSLYMQEVEVV